jgi:hypothetical protein
MAKIWPVYEGNRPTAGWPWAELPLSEAATLFELRPEDFVSNLDTTPRFGRTDLDLTFVGFKHIVVEVERNEARHSKWKPGFYKSRVKPRDAFGRLIQQALVSELGANNVVRVEWTPAVDSQGQPALKITVVIAPDATRKLKNGAVLDALVSLQERLREMRDDRVPIIEYATEAELKQDVGSQP